VISVGTPIGRPFLSAENVFLQILTEKQPTAAHLKKISKKISENA